MASPGLPLIAYGTAEAINAGTWANVLTPTVTAGQTDPFGGTDAYKIDDNDAAGYESRVKVLTALATTSLYWVVCLKADTATQSRFSVKDNTALISPLIVFATWSGGVPTFSTVGGTVVGSSALGGGWYAALVTCTWISGNVPQLELYGAGNTAASTGATIYYLNNLCLLDLLGAPRAFRRPKLGYRAGIAPSGTEDAWSYGDEYALKARLAWAPLTARGTPSVVSGWHGENESVSVNVSVSAMLAAGWDKQVLRVALNRSACTTYLDAYLRTPTLGWDPALEGNADYTAEVEVVAQTPFTTV